MQLLQQNYSNTFTVSLLQGCTGSQIKRTTIGRIYFIILEAVGSGIMYIVGPSYFCTSISSVPVAQFVDLIQNNKHTDKM